VPVVGGIATLDTMDLQVGPHSITAAYDGDANYAPSTSAAISEIITTAPSTVAVVDSPAGTSAFGDSVTFTATVSALTGGIPTGQVTFMDGATTLGTGTVGGGGVATFSTTTLAVGTHSIVAAYGGDTNHDPSQATVAHMVTERATTTVLAPAPNPSVFGQGVTLTATVSAGGPIPSGTVTFREGGTSLGSAGLDATGHASITVSTFSVGMHTLAADYGDTTNFTGSTSAAVTQMVNQANTTTVVTASVPGAVLGASVTFTATVSAAAPGAGTPTGMVTFFDGATMLGARTLSGGVATFTTTSLAVGTHNVTATYGGDGNFTVSTSTTPATVVVGALASTTALTSLVNPQVVGGVVTLMATVTGSGTPTGDVTFFDGGTTLGTVTLSSGQATFTTSTLAVGAHSITATYNGDSQFVPSTSAALIQNISKGPATVTLVGAPNPSIADQAVTFTATVSATAGGGPTGTVTFLDGATQIGTGALSGGVATTSISTLTVGAHTITANYGGDGTHTAGSGTTMQTVNPIPTTTALATSITPTVFGQSTTLTATIAASGSTPTGSVTFKDGSTSLGSGPVQVNASGMATLAVSSLGVGSHSLTAEFTGTTKYGASTSAAVSQTVGKASTTTSLATTSNSVQPGANVTFIAAVTVTTPGAGTPTGSITLTDGSTTLGTVPLSGGFVSFSTSSLALGSHTITATYWGDSSFTGSVSAGLVEVVSLAAVTASLTSSPTAPTYGQTVTLTATMIATMGGNPTGDVTFTQGTTVLGTATLNASGVASVDTHKLPAGSQIVTATYGGDSLHAAGSSASPTVTVAKRATATTLAAAPNPATLGDTVTLTATTTVSTTPALGGPMSDLVALAGTVTFKDGTTTLGTGTVGTDGTATLTTTTLALGSHSITATFEGADDYATSTSTAVTEQVNPKAAGDGGTDGMATDAGAPDATAADARSDGAGTDSRADAGGDTRADAGAAKDAGDAGAATDGGTNADGGTKPTGGSSGCGCAFGSDGGSAGAGLFGALALGAALALRRRRRR